MIPKIPGGEFSCNFLKAGIMAGSPPRAIRCDQTGETFSSISHAARKMGLSRQQISGVLNGSRTGSHTQGYTFTDLTYGTPVFTPQQRKKTGHSHPVKCDQTGKVFDSIADAANAMKLNPASISKHIRNVYGYTSVRGYTFSEVK